MTSAMGPSLFRSDGSLRAALLFLALRRARSGQLTKGVAVTWRTKQMDAATLYTIITLTSGPHRTTTRGFPSAVQCERAASCFARKHRLTPR